MAPFHSKMSISSNSSYSNGAQGCQINFNPTSQVLLNLGNWFHRRRLLNDLKIKMSLICIHI